ncbi:hypothetical protein DTO212C5_8936 [Paecilomyces variotii]|nr:hypothetical protein DTO212C5_8936 [Paecilomyces variotii]
MGQEGVATVSELLGKALHSDLVQVRAGPGGTKLCYLSGHDAVRIMNDLFRFDGWSSQICELKLADVYEEPGTGRWTAVYTATVRVIIRGTDECREVFHDGVGCGTGEKFPTRGGAIESAAKEAETDAIKRAVRLFGESTGNCLYEKRFQDAMRIKKQHATKPRVSVDDGKAYRLGDGRGLPSSSVSRYFDGSSKRRRTTNETLEDAMENVKTRSWADEMDIDDSRYREDVERLNRKSGRYRDTCAR